MRRLSRTHAVIAGVRGIPPDRMASKVKKSLTGLVLAGVSLLLVARFDAPWYVAAGGCLLGATVWSGELVMAPLRMLIALVADVLRPKPPTGGAGG